jgi:hypothetical protein
MTRSTIKAMIKTITGGTGIVFQSEWASTGNSEARPITTAIHSL